MSFNFSFPFKLAIKDKIANLIGNKLKEIKGGYFGRQRYLLTTLIYRFLPYLGFEYSRLVEWNFVLGNLPKRRLKVLDVGTSSSLFVYELAGRNYETFALDTCPYAEHLPNSIKFFQCDIVATPFPDRFFDALTAISAIEHIGLGFYGDPKYNDGDFKAMKEMKRILKDQGLLYLTTVVGKSFTTTPNNNCRIYDRNRLAQLTAPFIAEKQEYYAFIKNKWIKTSERVAMSRSLPSFALVCLLLRPRTHFLETSN